MQYHEVKINLELSSFASMITTNALSGGQVSVSGGSIGYASLWCDYVYLRSGYQSPPTTRRASKCKNLRNTESLENPEKISPYQARSEMTWWPACKLGKVIIGDVWAISVPVTSQRYRKLKVAASQTAKVLIGGKWTINPQFAKYCHPATMFCECSSLRYSRPDNQAIVKLGEIQMRGVGLPRSVMNI